MKELRARRGYEAGRRRRRRTSQRQEKQERSEREEENMQRGDGVDVKESEIGIGMGEEGSREKVSGRD